MDNSDLLPAWIKELFPSDLKKVLDDRISNPTTQGRKIAIEEDNVNDFV